MRIDKRLLQPTRRFPVIPERMIKAVTPHAIIVKDTDAFTHKSPLIIPDHLRNDLDKTFDIGEIVSIGSEVEGLASGDVVLYRSHHAYRIPNGLSDPFMFKIESYSIIAKV